MFLCYFHVFMVYVGLLIVWLCFMSDIVLFIDWLYCFDLFSCIAASLFNKLTYLLTLLTYHPADCTCVYIRAGSHGRQLHRVWRHEACPVCTCHLRPSRHPPRPRPSHHAPRPRAPASRRLTSGHTAAVGPAADRCARADAAARPGVPHVHTGNVHTGTGQSGHVQRTAGVRDAGVHVAEGSRLAQRRQYVN